MDVPVTFVVVVEDSAVPEDASMDGGSFSAGTQFDILANPEIADVIGSPDQINSIRLTNVQYEYFNFSGNVDAVINGEIVFTGGATFQTESVNVANADALGELFTLSGVNNTSISFENGMVVALTTGTSTADPAIFDTRLTISAVVTVEVNINDL